MAYMHSCDEMMSESESGRVKGKKKAKACSVNTNKRKPVKPHISFHFSGRNLRSGTNLLLIQNGVNGKLKIRCR